MPSSKLRSAVALVVAGGLAAGLAGCGSSGSSDNNTSTTDSGYDYFNGSLKNTNSHPLDGASISPEGSPSDSTCGVGFHNGTTSVFGTDFPVCVVDSDITADGTMNKNHVYVLDGSIHVGDGDQESHGIGASEAGSSSASQITLTIQPGTMVMGAAGTASHLVVDRSSDIVADGTASQPIIFGAASYDPTAKTLTDSADVTDLSGRGEWGGVIISGWAPVNDTNSEDQIKSEARVVGDDQGYFGGTDASDSSGTVSHVIVAESGYTIRPDEEIQGLTLEGVGSGTQMDHIQVLGSEDDGIEWFGGTVNMKHVVINSAADDSLDMDNGFSGSVQYALIRQGSRDGNHGFETDSKSDSDAGTPRATPDVANVTVLGNSGGGETRGARHREGIQGNWYNIAYLDDTNAPSGLGGFTTTCVDLNDMSGAGTAPTYSGGYCSSAKPKFDPDSDDESSVISSGLTNEDLTVNTSSWYIDQGSLTAADPTGIGLSAASYVGAVASSGDTWWDGWTVHLEYSK